MSKILIVEDDKDIAFIEKEYLELSKYEVNVCDNGDDGLQEALTLEYDLIILDIMLPGMNGYDICRKIRDKTDIPILMVTAKSEDIDNIIGFNCGADDYIVKPFSPSVLVARVKARLSQYERLIKTNEDNTEILTCGKIEINPDRCEVFVDGKEISLAKKEYELLLFLMRNTNKVFSREDLYEYIWGLDSLGDNTTVAVHVNRLREKIENNPSEPEYIQTVRGLGYIMKTKN